MKNVWCVKNMLISSLVCGENIYLPILHLPIVELRWKLQEKLSQGLYPKNVLLDDRMCKTSLFIDWNICYAWITLNWLHNKTVILHLTL